MDYHDQIRKYIVDNFLFGDAGKLTDSTSLLGAGIIDSTAILEIVQFIEKKFTINVNDDELLPENLDSVNSITAFITRKKTN
ncbi:MAG: acyl carrier protein [Chitinispirillaceae bacterium]|nr:acyl carrier protein [Chitinispirillaceae bacterium]